MRDAAVAKADRIWLGFSVKLFVSWAIFVVVLSFNATETDL